MKARLKDKLKAIELRKLGKSYREIQETVRVSKGLLSGWLKDAALTPDESVNLEKRIQDRRARGRMSSLVSNQTRKIERERRTFAEAEKLFKKFKSDPGFLLGVALYWAEGSKSTGGFQFMNADPDMILVMRRWMNRYLAIPNERIQVRLFMHNIPGYETIPAFWAKNLGIEPRQLTVTHYVAKNKPVRKGPGYKGCVRLVAHGVRYRRLMNAWQTLLIQYYGTAITRS